MTFSIIARDPATNAFGVAVSTAVPCVGARCPHVKARVGAVVTQAYTNIRLGIDGLHLLESGLSPEEALTAILQQDAGADQRQAAAIDTEGRVFAYSGSRCVQWFGHRTGQDYSVQGNMLVSGATLEAMERAFAEAKGSLADRLLTALEAGQEAGGDKRGRCSAALLVTLPEFEEYRLDVRVDEHPKPVSELRRIFSLLPRYYPDAFPGQGAK